MTQITISPTTYKDQPAISLESQHLQAIVLPQRGANLASLWYKPLNKQLLFQRPGASYRVQPYDGVYGEGENAGMDDMFPTIDACIYDQAPWIGTRLPDHGEVWGLPWQQTVDSDGITLRVHGVRLPYLLEKRLTFSAPDVLSMTYRLTNPTSFAFDYLYAAHCMFASEAGAQIVLPEGINRITLTSNNNGRLGKYGDQLAWPVATLPDGSTRDLRTLRGLQAAEVSKYYVNGALSEGWCGACLPTAGYSVGLTWSLDRLPYLAVLPNEGGWDDACSLYFEPNSCTFDRPDFGRYHNEAATLPGMETHTWQINLCVSQNLDFTRITPAGEFVKHPSSY